MGGPGKGQIDSRQRETGREGERGSEEIGKEAEMRQMGQGPGLEEEGCGQILGRSGQGEGNRQEDRN